MVSYDLWHFAHVLLFVYWLGADLGVLTLALAMKNPQHTCAQRRLLMRYALTIDLAPRAAFAFIAPVGLHLAASSGLMAVADWLVPALSLLAALWITAEIVAWRNPGTRLATRIYIGIGPLFVAGLVGFTSAGAISLVTGEPAGPAWLSLKLLLFGLIFLVSMLMAYYYAPLEGIFARLASEGSTPKIEAAIRRQVNHGATVTLILFVLLATIGFLGTVKPG